MYDRSKTGMLGVDDFMIATTPTTFNTIKSGGLTDESLGFS